MLKTDADIPGDVTQISVASKVYLVRLQQGIDKDRMDMNYALFLRWGVPSTRAVEIDTEDDIFPVFQVIYMN